MKKFLKNLLWMLCTLILIILVAPFYILGIFCKALGKWLLRIEFFAYKLTDYFHKKLK